MHQEEHAFLERRLALKHGMPHAVVRTGQIQSDPNHEARAGLYWV